jgi:two-component system chemotaxis response regulator CheB
VPFRDIITIGASAGGVEALRKIAAGLPASFPAAVFVVLHISPDLPNYLPQILSGAGPLPAQEPYDGELFQKGRIYVAPRDHHLLVERGRIAVARGPRENRSRPSIDALFRSAAYAYGPQVIGVQLTGMLDDGVAGLWAIDRAGGATVVQSPGDAEYPAMPRSALAEVQVDYVVPLVDIPSLLRQLSAQSVTEESSMQQSERERIELEVKIAGDEHGANERLFKLGRPTAFTCPECHGALADVGEYGAPRYRCHTGHAYSAGSLLAAYREQTGIMVFDAIRSFNEHGLLLEELGQRLVAEGRTDLGQQLLSDSIRAKERARALRAFEEAEAAGAGQPPVEAIESRGAPERPTVRPEHVLR